MSFTFCSVHPTRSENVTDETSFAAVLKLGRRSGYEDKKSEGWSVLKQKRTPSRAQALQGHDIQVARDNDIVGEHPCLRIYRIPTKKLDVTVRSRIEWETRPVQISATVLVILRVPMAS